VTMPGTSEIGSRAVASNRRWPLATSDESLRYVVGAPRKLVGILWFLAFCSLLFGVEALADQAPASTEESVTRNVQVGGPDYPTINPNPTRVIRLKGYLPMSLRIQLIANFATWPNSDPQKGQPATCGYALSSITYEPFHVDAPFGFSKLANSFYSAVVAEDKYLPGRCGWHLRSLEFMVLNGIGVFHKGVFATVFYPEHSNVMPDKLYRGSINLWCKKDPYPPDPTHPMNCSTLSMLADAFFVGANQMASIPAAQRNDQLHTWILPDTEVLEVNFHDLDSISETAKYGQ
jgi:hypothetical protein